MYGFGVVINDDDGVYCTGVDLGGDVFVLTLVVLAGNVPPDPGILGLGVLMVSGTIEAGMYGLGVVINDDGDVFCGKVVLGGPVFVPTLAVPADDVPTDPGMFGLGVLMVNGVTDAGMYPFVVDSNGTSVFCGVCPVLVTPGLPPVVTTEAGMYGLSVVGTPGP
jgi:hypothetical protein